MWPAVRDDYISCDPQIITEKDLIMVRAKSFLLKGPFEGFPREDDFVLEDKELPEISAGEFLCEALYWSVDPYMRLYSKPGATMMGMQVAKILASRNDQFPVGKFVVGHFGWRTHTVVKNVDKITYIVDELKDFPMSIYLGLLGLPGNSAYFGFLDICNPKSGEIVAVSTAAGAVGNVVGQIAKIKGCIVIGLTGSDEKVEWLKELGFDHVINYKTTPNLNAVLEEIAPSGIDCYFDNVGGEISSIIMQNMSRFGRVSVCGAICSYNNDAESIPKAPILQPRIVSHELKLQGFVVFSYADRWMEGIKQNLQWITQGKLKQRETLYEGFEKMPQALMGLLRGDNIGKAVVKA